MIEIATGQATSKAAPAAFFAKWIDHSSWGEWSPDIDWVNVDGPVQRGVRGTIKPKGGPKTKFVISACEPDREYTDTSSLPGARLVFQHMADQVDDRTELAVRVTLNGPLARLWSLVLGKGFRQSAQVDLDRLVALVER